MSVKLIVDSGSTKTDWVLIREGFTSNFFSKGINPSIQTVLPTHDELSDLFQHSKIVEEIHYFGAGVIDKTSKTYIRDWLSSIFTNAHIFSIHSDIIGAAIATAQNKPGIISILGTGSNSCLYDGRKIIDAIPSLGYIASNEGAGTEIGKMILQSYFYRHMPNDVRNVFEQKYNISKADVVKALYQGDNPTRFLSSFTEFINQNPNPTWRKEILTEAFQEFIDIRIKKYQDYLTYDLHFVGSIAYFCQDVLMETLKANNLTCTSILQRPIEGLVKYYKKQ